MSGFKRDILCLKSHKKISWALFCLLSLSCIYYMRNLKDLGDKLEAEIIMANATSVRQNAVFHLGIRIRHNNLKNIQYIRSDCCGTLSKSKLPGTICCFSSLSYRNHWQMGPARTDLVTLQMVIALLQFFQASPNGEIIKQY